MSKGRGKLAYLQVDVGSSVFKDLANITDMSISQSQAEIDVSDADTQGWSEFIQGDKEATIDVTLNFAGSSTQEIIHDAWLNGTTFAIKYGYRAYTSAFATTVKVNSMTIDAPSDNVRTMKATLRIIVAPTTTTASANLDTAGTYGKQRGKQAGFLLALTTSAGVAITTAGTTGTKNITLSATPTISLKVNQRVMFVGIEKVYTIATVTSATAYVLTENLTATLTTAATFAEIENRTTLSFSGSCSEIDTTDATSSNFKEFISGDSGMTIDLACNYDDASKMQDVALYNYYNSVTSEGRWFYGIASTKKYYKANVIINKGDITSPSAGVQTMSTTIRVSAKPTAVAQA